MISFRDFRKLQTLGEKRHPMFENNRFGKYAIFAGGVFWAGYLIFFGVLFGLSLETHSMEGYHLLNGGLIVILALDFLTRLPLQKVPTQDIKPFMLMPIRLKRIVNYILLHSGLNPANLFWMFLFVPFALLTVERHYGMSGVIGYCFGIWLLMLCNNYWLLICKLLFNRNPFWSILPILFYMGIITGVFAPMMFDMGIPKRGPVFYFFVDLGEGFIHGNPLYIGGTIILLAFLWIITQRLLLKSMKEELYKPESSVNRKENVSEYRFFERFGEIGEYMRLEMKMMLRNKACKTNLLSAISVVILFTMILTFTDVYDNTSGMKSFIFIYDFMIFGITFLGTLMSYEGNYIDGLLSRKESVYSLLRAKYLLYCIGALIPLILLIPAIVADKIALMDTVAWCLFTMGPIYFGLFQLAVYNKQTIPLNRKLTARNSSSGMQLLVNFLIMIVPMSVYGVANLLLEETTVNLIWIVCGIATIITSKWWLKNIYNRFMEHRYSNLEGFRNSR